METLTLIVLLIIAVLISAVIDQVIPKVSLPLIQVGMGIIIALLGAGVVEVELEPDLFLVLFIAPLLYLEAKDADKAILWKNKRPILSLAIGLVVATTLIIGFILNAMMPSIPLAAAFALGAALGPTDAVAVTSLSKQVSIPERQWGILKGELLLNDASGIVSFQFAIAAVVTGSFSLLNAGVDFLIEFIGGLIVGIALGYLANFILRMIREIGLESTTFHVLYEICIPFVVYMVSTAMHVSGIIAVVVAGLVNVIAPRTVSPAIAHMNIVSTNVWNVISFTLNGLVFVMLGTQIPTSMLYTWEDRSVSNLMVIFLVIVTTLTLMAVRFLWCSAMEFVHSRRTGSGRFTRKELKNALLVTLCGAKGTITLSILFTIPVFIGQTASRFPERHLIIFIGCGVILCTLLIATFLVPLVAPKKVRKQTEIEARQNYYECLADILRNVIEELTSQQTRNNRRSTKTVIRAYQNRLSSTKEMIDVDTEPDTELRIQTLDWEREYIESLMDADDISEDTRLSYLARLDRIEDLTKHTGRKISLKRMLFLVRILFNRTRARLSKLAPRSKAADRAEEMRILQMDCAQYVVGKLRGAIGDANVSTEDASRLLLQYENVISNLRKTTTSVTTTIKISDESDDIMRIAYQIELEQIQKMYESDRISRAEAKNMRENVYLMQMDLEDRF